jgi:hypothetical protein
MIDIVQGGKALLKFIFELLSAGFGKISVSGED